MALFKVSKGLKANLPPTKTEGYCWYTTDDSLFYIDYKDENGTLQRKALNAKDAETLTGASLSTILKSSDVEIPTSKAVLDALNAKLDKADAGSDWNQNDDTKPDYVKNRPFYESISLTTFLEEQQIDFSSPFIIPNSDIVQGKTYFVHWDDAEYTIEATAKDIFGDGSIWIPYLEQADGLFTIEASTMNAADKGVHNVAIYTTELSLKTIDEKFIPDTIARKDSVVRSVCGGYPDSNGNVNVNYDDLVGNKPSNIRDGSGIGSILQGSAKEASGRGSNAYGDLTIASGDYSHAEGARSRAKGTNSHAEGVECVSIGSGSHAEGFGTASSSSYQHVEGKYNIEDLDGKYANIVGNGDRSARSNAHTLDWSGNAWYAGKVSIGTTSNVPAPTDVNDLVTKQYVDNKFSTKTASVTLAADSWTGTESPYSQEVTIDGVTANSKVDLNPTGEQLNSIATNRTILNTANDNGTVTVYAVGNKPMEDYTMQVTITEV